MLRNKSTPGISVSLTPSARAECHPESHNPKKPPAPSTHANHTFSLTDCCTARASSDSPWSRPPVVACRSSTNHT